MDIPHHLVQEIQDGKCVVFLGAGASLGAKDSKGNLPPDGRKLGEMLSDRFLGGKLRDGSLNKIAELAISESSLPQVQEFIKELLEPFRPSTAHKLISKFKWAGIATTNYDRLIEEGYESNRSALQTPKLFIEDGDRVEDSMRDPSAVMLLKLHGCITRLSNPKCPLILTTDQYVTHRRGRERIFDHLKNWACERSLVFIGYGIQDSDIAVRLAALFNVQGDPKKAVEVLEKALNANRNDRSLHYHYAKQLMSDGNRDGDLLAYHLQRAFSPGDNNYDAQLLYGRQLHLNGDREGAKQVFNRLKEAKLSPELKRKLLYPVNGTFYGTVIRIEGNYLYLSREGANEWTYAHQSNIDNFVWRQLIMGSRCRYRVAFNLYGAGAYELQIASANG